MSVKRTKVSGLKSWRAACAFVVACVGSVAALTGCSDKPGGGGGLSGPPEVNAYREEKAAASAPALGDDKLIGGEKSKQIPMGGTPATGRGSVTGKYAPWDEEQKNLSTTVTPSASGGGRAGFLDKDGRARFASGLAAGTANPNFYISNDYLGGEGARDRIQKLIDEGIMVDGKQVKLECFSRSYKQSFPMPAKAALAVFADTERSKIVQSGDKTYLQIGLQAYGGERPRRPMLNVALVIDCSGSMGDEGKLDHAKAAAHRLIDSLQPADRLALVTFDDAATVRRTSSPVGDKRSIHQAIDALSPGSGTNIYDGLKAGYAELKRSSSPETASLALLLSDGEVTTGVTDTQAFRNLASNNADKEVQTSAVGMGLAFNEELMMGVAESGQGNYHFLKDGADAQRVFAKELDDLTSLVARAVKLRIVLADGVKLVRVLGARRLDANETVQAKTQERRIDRKVYEELGIASNRKPDEDEKLPGIKLHIPNFYRGTHHLVMLEVDIPRGSGNRNVAEVFAKYKDVVFRRNQETKAVASIGYTPDRAAMLASTNRLVKKNVLGFQTGEALKQASDLLQSGRAADAMRAVDERMVVLGVASKEWLDRDLERDGKLLDRYKGVISRVARDPGLAGSDYGQYLSKSLTYSAYQLTR